MPINSAGKEVRPVWLEVQKNKNKALLFGCLMGWSVCIATYAYQYLGGFVHWPYWCLIHLFSLVGPIPAMIVGAYPLDSPPPLPARLIPFVPSLWMPLFTMTTAVGSIGITPPVTTRDWVYVIITFLTVDMHACISLASLTRLKYTFYWPFICLVFGFAFSSGYGLPAAANTDPLWCKIVVCSSAIAVAALSTFYLYLRRRRHVSNEIPRVALARCFV